MIRERENTRTSLFVFPAQLSLGVSRELVICMQPRGRGGGKDGL